MPLRNLLEGSHSGLATASGGVPPEGGMRTLGHPAQAGKAVYLCTRYTYSQVKKVDIIMEGSNSGLVRTLGKRVWGNPPRVRIPHLPRQGKSQILLGEISGRHDQIVRRLGQKIRRRFCGKRAWLDLF